MTENIIIREGERIISFGGISLPLVTTKPKRPQTTSLFTQTNTGYERTPPTFSLQHNTYHKGVYQPALKELYMLLRDPTEYTFAITVFGSWDWFQKVLNSKAGIVIKQWREELQMMIRSEAVQSLIKTATEEGAKGTTAAKYVAEHAWDKAKRSKKVTEELTDEFQEDAERIGLSLIK